MEQYLKKDSERQADVFPKLAAIPVWTVVNKDEEVVLMSSEVGNCFVAIKAAINSFGTLAAKWKTCLDFEC